MGRSSIHGILLVVVALAGGCRDSGGAALRTGDAYGEVTFEVGGDGPSLSELLRQGAAPPAEALPPDRPRAEDVSDAPARRYRTVRLAPGQTLGELCAEQLGSAARWREVRVLNGWSEEDVKRLPPNTVVKLPPY